VQYADPFSVECEECGFEDQYPLNNILKFSAVCTSCGFKLNKCAEVMHKNIKSHNASLWPTHFIFEGFEVFNVDIDDVTDDEFDSINTLQDFCFYVECKLGASIKNSLFNIPMLALFRSEYKLDELLNIQLTELGNIVYKNG
jgi:hypothetical protein